MSDISVNKSHFGLQMLYYVFSRRFLNFCFASVCKVLLFNREFPSSPFWGHPGCEVAQVGISFLSAFVYVLLCRVTGDSC